jgi:hypothetical protein
MSLRARATGAAILDPEVARTPARVSPEQVARALRLLQVDAGPNDIAQMAGTHLGTIVVAIVNHLARNGLTMAVALEGETFLDDAADPSERAERPRYDTLG